MLCLQRVFWPSNTRVPARQSEPQTRNHSNSTASSDEMIWIASTCRCHPPFMVPYSCVTTHRHPVLCRSFSVMIHLFSFDLASSGHSSRPYQRPRSYLMPSLSPYHHIPTISLIDKRLCDFLWRRSGLCFLVGSISPTIFSPSALDQSSPNVVGPLFGFRGEGSCEPPHTATNTDTPGIPSSEPSLYDE